MILNYEKTIDLTNRQIILQKGMLVSVTPGFGKLYVLVIDISRELNGEISVKFVNGSSIDGLMETYNELKDHEEYWYNEYYIPPMYRVGKPSIEMFKRFLQLYENEMRIEIREDLLPEENKDE